MGDYNVFLCLLFSDCFPKLIFESPIESCWKGTVTVHFDLS